MKNPKNEHDGNLLMVGNFSSGTGYAWKMIGSCFCQLGSNFIQQNKKAYVCFPKVDIVPDQYLTSKIEVVEFDFSNAGFLEIVRFILDRNIRTVYLINRGFHSFRYFPLRLAGVRHIVVHDHTSGERTKPKFIKGVLKQLVNKIGLIPADKVIAISDYVRQRQIDVGCVPPDRVVTILNGIDVSGIGEENHTVSLEAFQIPPGYKVIFCNGRAHKDKGIQFVIKAADVLINNRKRNDLCFLFCGDGPDLNMFRNMIKELNLESRFYCPGHVDSIRNILSDVYACVVPSIWQEGFGLVVIEAMLAGVPVIASKVGGMAEIIDEGVDGYYVEPGDYTGIADLTEKLANDRELRDRIGRKAMEKVKNIYDSKIQQSRIVDVFRELGEV